MLNAREAELITRARLKFEDSDGGGDIGWWTNTDDEIRWRLVVPTDGEYSISARVSCARQFSGSRVGVTVAGRSFPFSVPDTGEWYYYVDLALGNIPLKAGTYPVTVKPRK